MLDGCVAEALFFDIGQTAVEEERKAARGVCEGAGVSLYEVSEVDWRNRIPRPLEMLVVPRNLIFAMLAVPYARVLSCDRIVLGSTRDDEPTRDSNQGAIDSFNGMLATIGQPMRLVAPWLDLNWGKVDIVRWTVQNLGMSFLDATRSCYSRGEPCGKCPACESRLQALAQAQGSLS
jgi:7-cyano-7-deazaguanine synthase in queuosine biosynthesis